MATWETERARSASVFAVCGCQMRNCLLSTKPKYGVSISGIASFSLLASGEMSRLSRFTHGMPSS